MKQMREFEHGVSPVEVVQHRWKEANRLLTVIKGHLDDYKDGEEATITEQRVMNNVVRRLEEAATALSVDVASVMANLDAAPATSILGGRLCQID